MWSIPLSLSVISVCFFCHFSDYRFAILVLFYCQKLLFFSLNLLSLTLTKIWELVLFSVTRFGKIKRLFAIFEAFWYLTNFLLLCKFGLLETSKYWTNNLAIWSHWSLSSTVADQTSIPLYAYSSIQMINFYSDIFKKFVSHLSHISLRLLLFCIFIELCWLSIMFWRSSLALLLNVWSVLPSCFSCSRAGSVLVCFSI